MTYASNDIMSDIMKRHFRRRREQKVVFTMVLALMGALVLIADISPALVAQLGGDGTQTHAGVGENPINSLYAQLEGRSEDLALREAELIEREIATGIEERSRQSAVMLYALFGMLVLMLLNALFDVFEMRELKFLEQQIRKQGA